MVAPLAGAWIEISLSPPSGVKKMSLPSRERGLKFHELSFQLVKVIVAPLAGAWIEIGKYQIPKSVDQRRSPRGSVD